MVDAVFSLLGSIFPNDSKVFAVHSTRRRYRAQSKVENDDRFLLQSSLCAEKCAINASCYEDPFIATDLLIQLRTIKM